MVIICSDGAGPPGAARRTHRRGLIVVLSLVTAMLALPAVARPAAAVVWGEEVTDSPGAVVALTLTGGMAGGDQGQGAPASAAGQICGGTAVADDLVLTAAHCFHGESGLLSRQPADVQVIAGRVDLDEDGGVAATGTALYVHPDYEGRRSRYDVALLRVAQPLGVEWQVLATADAEPLGSGVQTRVLGWGLTESGPPRPTALHQAVVTVSSRADCRAAYAGTLDDAVHLCAGGGGTADTPAADACAGDSGGPLLLAEGEAEGVQVGITAFGPDICGVGEPGVYTRVEVVRPFIDQVLAGEVEPTAATDTPAIESSSRNILRIAAEDPNTTMAQSQAVAASRAVFADGSAELVVLARPDLFADALAGSALGYGLGPLLFTGSDGMLGETTEAELRRTLPTGSNVYLLGGSAALPTALEDRLVALGYVPARLAGADRVATSVAIAREVVRLHGSGGDRPPFATVMIAAGQHWPDAVLSGQLGAWWGYPVLLTGPDRLPAAVVGLLAELAVERVLLIGGEAAVGAAVADDVRTLLPDAVLTRLSGPTRVGTAVAIAGHHLAELAALGEPAPDAAVVVNARRDDAFAHILSATPVLGATAAIAVAVEGEDGSVVTGEVRRTVCGLGLRPIVIGGRDLVAPSAAAEIRDLMAGLDC